MSQSINPPGVDWAILHLSCGLFSRLLRITQVIWGHQRYLGVDSRIGLIGTRIINIIITAQTLYPSHRPRFHRVDPRKLGMIAIAFLLFLVFNVGQRWRNLIFEKVLISTVRADFLYLWSWMTLYHDRNACTTRFTIYKAQIVIGHKRSNSIFITVLLIYKHNATHIPYWIQCFTPCDKAWCSFANNILLI